MSVIFIKTLHNLVGTAAKEKLMPYVDKILSILEGILSSCTDEVEMIHTQAFGEYTYNSFLIVLCLKTFRYNFMVQFKLAFY